MRSLNAALAAVSLLVLSIGGVQGWTDFHALNPNHQRTELPDGRVHLSHDVHHVFAEEGTFFKAKYEAIHHKKWHFVELHHHADFLSQVDCGASNQELFVKHPSETLKTELAKQDYEWTVLTAHQKFHCSETAIFRGVTGATYHQETDTLQIHTVQFGYTDVFEFLKYDMDTDHHRSTVEDEETEWDNEVALPSVAEGDVETVAGRGMQQQFFKKWRKKIKKAVKKVVKKVKKVVKRVIKRVVTAVRTVIKLLGGTYEASKHFGTPKLSYNKDVAKKFSKWNFNGEFKLAASAEARAGIRFRISIKRFRFIIAEAYYYGYFRGGVRGSFSGRYKYEQSKNKQIANIKLCTITFAIGPVPVVIIITVPINAGYEVDVDGRLNLNMLLSVDGSIKQGIRLTRSKGFQVINEKHWKTVRDFSPRRFRVEVGLSAYIQVQLRANINFLGAVQAGLQITAEALMQVNTRCRLLLQINLQPVITIGGQINIGYKKLSFYKKNFGPKALVSWKIPVLNYCIPQRRRSRSRRYRRGEHRMQLQTDYENTDDSTEPYNHHDVEMTPAGDLESNSTGITWFGDASCPKHPDGPMTMSFSMQFLDGNLTNSTQVILTAARNVTTNSNTSIDPETEEPYYAYELTNIQQTYQMLNEGFTPGFKGNMTHWNESDPEEQYATAGNSTQAPYAIAKSIAIHVAANDSTDITVTSDEMFCGSVELYAKKWNDDNSTFKIFAAGGGDEEEKSLFEKFKAYAIYVPILCVCILAIVVTVICVQKRKSQAAHGAEWAKTRHDMEPIMEQDAAVINNNSAVAVDPRTAVL